MIHDGLGHLRPSSIIEASCLAESSDDEPIAVNVQNENIPEQEVLEGLSQDWTQTPQFPKA
jgi:hypothetical protein